MITLPEWIALVEKLRAAQCAGQSARAFYSPEDEATVLVLEATVDLTIRRWHDERQEEGGPDDE